MATRQQQRETARTHREVARQARGYADRATKAQRRRDLAIPVTLWIDLYMRRYRSLTGRPRYAGPAGADHWRTASHGVKRGQGGQR